jgi:chemotaxis protein methyltransferase CheR
MSVPLHDEEYRLFSEWLSREFGLWFGPERREILRARLDLRRAELGFASFHELFFHLKFHPEREVERQRLVPHLTNNESYFFRERAQLDVFRDDLLPELVREASAERRTELRILSAGCSAGQEPYTLALLLKEAQTPRSVRFRITGVDLDPAVLERARSGRYTEHSFRGVDEEFRERYFDAVSRTEWELVPEVREQVEFLEANLADPTWSRSLPPQDVIFCRNVLIYFDADGIHRAARGLHDALAPGGRLFLGHAESLSRLPTPFVPQRRPGAVFYRKPPVAAGRPLAPGNGAGEASGARRAGP